MVEEYGLTNGTYDKIAHRYAELHFDYRFWREPYEIVKELLPKGSLILDAGCGPGRDSKYFLENGYRVIGIDRSEGMLEEARVRVPNGDFRKMDMMSLTFDAEYFDAVWASASLLHIKMEDANKVLDEFRRVLKTSGIFFVSVKQGKGSEIKTYPDGSKRFFNYYSVDGLKEIVRGNGFDIIQPYKKDDKEGDTWLCLIAKKKAL